MVIAVVAFLGAGTVLFSTQQDQATAAKMAEEKAMMEKKAMEEKALMEEKQLAEKKAMMEKESAGGEEVTKDIADGESATMDKKEAMTDVALVAGAYLPYEASKLAMANSGDVVLFFRASWCPSCRALDADINAHRGDIPAGLTILDVNYDTETALKQKYGVTYQHTLVQVAADGTLIKKWSGGSTLGTVVAQVQ